MEGIEDCIRAASAGTVGFSITGLMHAFSGNVSTSILSSFYYPKGK